MFYAFYKKTWRAYSGIGLGRPTEKHRPLLVPAQSSCNGGGGKAMNSELERALKACADNGVEGLKNAQLKSAEDHPATSIFGRLGNLSVGIDGENPLPLTTAIHGYNQKQWAEAKQSREDQRVIAEAIRNGEFKLRMGQPTPSNKASLPGTAPLSPKKKRKPTRTDTLAPCIEWAIDDCISKDFNGLSDFSRLILDELQSHCDEPGYPIIGAKPEALLVKDQAGGKRWVTFGNILSRIKRKYKDNGGLLDAKRKVGRSVSGRVVGLP